MNNCICFRNDMELNLYLDRELPVQRSAELDSHINICGSCLTRYEIARQLKNLLAQSQQLTKAPAGLRDKIVSEIGIAASRGTGIREAILNFFRGRPLISIGAASSLAIIFTFFLFLRPRGPENPELVRTMVGEHDEYVAHFGDAFGIQSSDPVLISEWLEANDEAAVDLSKCSALPVLFGACAMDEGGKHVTCLFFDQGEKRVSFFILPGGPDGSWGRKAMTLNNISFYCGNSTGHNFVAWTRDGYTRILVSRLPEENLLKMAEILI